MTEILDFIQQQLAIDKQYALDAKHDRETGVWMFRDNHPVPGRYLRIIDELGYTVVGDFHHDVDSDPWWRLPHIARHDPARVLADVEAKRRVLERHSSFDFPADEDDGPGGYAWTARSDGHCYGEVWPCAELRDLAAPYVGRPGFKPEWRLP